jgi:hypothetical protein
VRLQIRARPQDAKSGRPLSLIELICLQAFL